MLCLDTLARMHAELGQTSRAATLLCESDAPLPPSGLTAAPATPGMRTALDGGPSVEHAGSPLGETDSAVGDTRRTHVHDTDLLARQSILHRTGDNGNYGRAMRRVKWRPAASPISRR